MKQKEKVRFPLVVKLIVITMIIVVVSAGASTLVSSYFFIRDTEVRTQENNMNTVEVFSTRMANQLEEVYASAVILLDTLRVSTGSAATEVFKSNFFHAMQKLRISVYKNSNVITINFLQVMKKNKVLSTIFWKVMPKIGIGQFPVNFLL